MRKMNTPDFEELLLSGGVTLPPLEISVVSLETPQAEDARVDVRWGERVCRYVVEYKGNAKPQTLAMAIEQAKRLAEESGDVQPMVMMPYLSADKLMELEAREVSGIDLCGNGYVIAPDRFSVFRTGNTNLYPDSKPLRSAYRGDSSLVARALLLQAEFESVGEIAELIERRGGQLAMSTVSKALKRMKEDLVIERGSSPAVRVIDREKLLDQLTQNYSPPEKKGSWTGRVELSTDAISSRVKEVAGQQDLVRTGMNSAERYAVFKGEQIIELYTEDPVEEVLRQIGANADETRAFPNLRLIQTRDSRVFFDARQTLVASPIQTWLEMASGDKRSREAAEPIRQKLIRGEEFLIG